MQIIIPMAGMGVRFVKEGYSTPKPLIPIDGKPIIEHIASLFPGDHRFIFICNNEHLTHTNMRAELERIKPQAQIVGIPPHTLGPVHTVLQGIDSIDDNQPVILSYCDIFIHWNFEHFTRQMQVKNFDAALVVFKGFHPPLSREGFYASVREDNNLAVEVREKGSFTENKMDSWNSAGVHYFKSGALVKKYFKKTEDLGLTINNEYYVSVVHNALIADNLKNGLYPVDYFISWGKPVDVREYQYWSKHFNNTY